MIEVVGVIKATMAPWTTPIAIAQDLERDRIGAATELVEEITEAIIIARLSTMMIVGSRTKILDNKEIATIMIGIQISILREEADLVMLQALYHTPFLKWTTTRPRWEGRMTNH